MEKGKMGQGVVELVDARELGTTGASSADSGQGGGFQETV